VILTTAPRRCLLLENVAKLGEGAQELSALNGWCRRQLTCGRDAEKRIGYRLAQFRRIPPAAERKQLPCKGGIDLIDVDGRGLGRATESDISAGRADVANRHRHMARQLALDVH
jgi:hypothetical protein